MEISNSKIDAIIDDLLARHKAKTDQIRSLHRDAGQILRQIRELESARQCPSAAMKNCPAGEGLMALQAQDAKQPARWRNNARVLIGLVALPDRSQRGGG